MSNVTKLSEAKPIHNYTGYGWEGENYRTTRNMDIKEIAKMIRQFCKKKFQSCTFSVTIERYSMGQSMHISLMSAPFDALIQKGSVIQGKFTTIEEQGYPFEKYGQLNHFTFLRDTYESVPVPGYNNGNVLSPEAWEVMTEVVKYVESFNYSDCDGMIDYFNVNFHTHFNIGKWDKPFKQT